ncbi:hypothetical protein ABMA28_009571 [Loxostege sticticalis]|uniref:Uncharacterized protein n=1 Tax=Loxostege sticticalis TaxID=481309 RepID=A0ABD0SEL8_LOXSC
MKRYPGTKVIQCTLNRQKPVKAAIIVFGDLLRVINDPQLVTETESVAILESGRLKIGVVSKYYEGDEDIEPYLEHTEAVCNQLKTHTNNILIGGDVNAWSHWWGSKSENERGHKYNSFLAEMELHILNTGDTPTFEEYRQGRWYTSRVDVTSCTTNLLGKIKEWKVNRGLTTSDHNAITFTLETGSKLKPVPIPTTRKYNTKKANWSVFDEQLHKSLAENNINAGAINAVSNGGDLDTITEAYTKAIEVACESAIPRVGKRGETSRPQWWTDELEKLRKDVLRKKRRIRNAAPIRVEAVVEEYREAKTLYVQKSQEAQTQSWKEFCTTQERESMWDGIYRVIRRTKERQDDVLLRGLDGRTLSPKQSADLLATTFYPDDSVLTDEPYHTQLRRKVEKVEQGEWGELRRDDPPFTAPEVETVLRAQNPKKAPGPDGFTSDICARAIRCNMEVFMAIANKCLAISYFPVQWKRAHVVILTKPGKSDYTHPKSYRPIGLLSILGKTLEKLLVGRLQWHLLPTLNQRQYGFMPQRGTEDALYDLLRHVRTEICNKKSVVMVSLDIEGAFDNAWWPALKDQLQRRRCPKNLYLTVKSYLEDRKIVVNYAGETSERETTKGCVQGSIGGPTFWNIILDPLLQTLSSEEVYCQAFADDGVLVFSGKSMAEMEGTINHVLEKTYKWGRNNKLNFAAHKTKAMLLTKKLKFTPPTITMSGTNIALVDEIKLLGLTIDRNLNFNKHVTDICKRTTDIYKQLACAAKVTWGLNGEIIRTIYVAVVEPIVTYGACAWAEATKLEMNKTKLDALQRGFAQRACKAYRTTSLTSALVLSGLLPIDLRIQEAATLYEAKKGFSVDFLPPGRMLEKKVKVLDLPHPSYQITTDYELLEDMDEGTQKAMAGKVGAALTWWEDGRETTNEIFSLDPACTVFQSELYALHRALEKVKESNEPIINILSDSRSSLELLSGPKLVHPLVKNIKECIADIRAQGRRVRLFWLRAHVGTPGNERADQLAKEGAEREAEVLDYAEVPLSYVKRKIREESLLKWQDRYDSSVTGSTTKAFLPDVRMAYKLVREARLTPLQVQIMTGHGGFGEYLHRFKLKSDPGCECDPAISETVWHILLECPRFVNLRHNLECVIEKHLTKQKMTNLLEEKHTRGPLLEYMERVARVAVSRNSTLTPNQNVIPSTPADTQPQPTQPTLTHKLTTFSITQHGETGKPGIRIRGVALFMSDNTERMGIAFCGASSSKSITISPGLGALLNGSTSKSTMRLKVYNALPVVLVEGCRCRIVREKNKLIALFCGDDTTAFRQACEVLQKVGSRGVEGNTTPKKISVDAMIVGYQGGETRDYLGVQSASRYHEVVVYEDRGQHLGHLIPQHRDQGAPATPTDHWGHPVRNPNISGSERLEQRVEEEREQAKQGDNSRDGANKLSLLVKTVAQAMGSILPKTIHKTHITGRACSGKTAVEEFTTSEKSPHKTICPTRTRADMGQVAPPLLIPANSPKEHMLNAFMEFVAVTKATRKVSEMTCSKILQTYLRGNMELLRVLLDEAEAAVYDNDSCQVLHGKMSGEYMAAYCNSVGFVEREPEEEGKTEGKLRFRVPPGESTVVVAKCTKVMLDEKMLVMAEAVAGDISNGKTPEHWTEPTFTWVNGVPGCGKTTWVVSQIDTNEDIIVTTTTEAAKDLREKLEPRIGEQQAKRRVRTMASLLVNGIKEGESCKRLVVDEALMNHFGSIVLAIQIVKASKALLIGDNNQLPYIDRNNLFQMKYHRPNTVTNITKELLCTWRNPMDVAYALNEIYGGIYSAKCTVRSLAIKGYTGARIPKTDNTLYLVHTQAEKSLLISQGYGTNEGSRTLTIHESQGLTFETVYIICTTAARKKIHKSIPHAVVAISRHTKTCIYYTDTINDDATARLITRVERATDCKIINYNLRMAIQNGNERVRDAIIAFQEQKPPSPNSDATL